MDGNCISGKVKYVNENETYEINLKKFFLKRKPYAYEQEVRWIYYIDINYKENNYASYNEYNLMLSVNPADLIERVVISPFANKLFISSVKKLMSSYPRVRIEQSVLASQEKGLRFIHDGVARILQEYAKRDCKECQGVGYRCTPGETQFCSLCIKKNWDTISKKISSVMP